MSSNDVQLITLSKNDLKQPIITNLAKFLSIGFAPDSEELWKKRFSFWWDANPQLSDTEAIGWMLYDSTTEEIKGFLGKIPLYFQHGNDILKACAATSWYVSDDMRGIQSTRLFMKFNKEKDTQLFLDTTPSIPVQKMLPEIGFKRLRDDAITNYLGIGKLNSFFKLASSICNKKKGGGINYIYHIIDVPIKIMIHIFPKGKGQKDKPIMNLGKYECRIISDPKELKNHIHKHNREELIVISKDEETLNWILFSPEIQTLSNRKVAQLYDNKSNSYCGYFVYDIKEDVKSKLNYLVVREIELLNCDKKLIKLMIKHIHTSAKINNCSIYTIAGHIIHNQELKGLISKHILLKRKAMTSYFLKFNTDKLDLTDDELIGIFCASGLDPDAGFI